MGVIITGTGKSLPKLIVKNEKMMELVETNNQWIIDRTGIEERHIAVEEMGIDLAVAAAKQALGWTEGGMTLAGEGGHGRKAVDPSSIGLVVVATVTPDAIVPCMASKLKCILDLPNAATFDVNAACSGFIYGTWIANSLMKNGGMAGSNTNEINRALVVGVERLTRITNWTDRSTCILFGDGAGCALLELDPERAGIMGSYVRNYDDPNGALTVGMEYYKTPFSREGENSNMQIYMAGTQVFKFAVTAIEEVMTKVLNDTGVSPDEVKYYVPHQANLRIIKAAAQRFKQPLEKFQVNIQHTGNASSASIPMALADLMASGNVQKGDKIMIVGFGGGLSAGAILIEI